MTYIDTVVRPATLTAMLRGFRRSCPQCGRGRLFKPGWRNILKLADACPHCGEHFEGIRADDAPAYFTILLVGHIVVPLVLVVERYGDQPPLWFHAALWLPLSVVLALYLLPHIKGTVIALLWAHRMPAPKPSTGSFDSSA